MSKVSMCLSAQLRANPYLTKESRLDSGGNRKESSHKSPYTLLLSAPRPPLPPLAAQVPGLDPKPVARHGHAHTPSLCFFHCIAPLSPSENVVCVVKFLAVARSHGLFRAQKRPRQKYTPLFVFCFCFFHSDVVSFVLKRFQMRNRAAVAAAP